MIEDLDAAVKTPRDRLKVLVIDDNQLDAALALAELKRGGLIVESVVVQDEPGLREALREFEPDIIVCDFSFPHFDGLAAQRIVREAYPDVPLIFVSGAISEERAVMALQSGAVDYVMKSSLVRLPSAVERAVRESGSKITAERRARHHAARLEALWRLANDPALHGEALIRAMLDQSAGDICLRQPFHALLCRMDDDDRHATVIGVGGDELERKRSGMHIGDRVALEHPNDRGGRSYAWDDVALASDAPLDLIERGWHAVICTHFNVGDQKYWLSFASTVPARIVFADDDFGFLDAVASSFANQIQVNALQDSLRDEEERSRRHAKRLEMSWHIANDPRLGDSEKFLAMLAQAAGSIWPGHGYRGMLWRISGAEMRLEAIAQSEDHGLLAEALPTGSIWPVQESMVGRVLAEGGGSASWDDLRSSAAASEFARAEGAHSTLLTTFNAGGAKWALGFVSGRAPNKPLGPLEHAYIEVLASFFSSHVQQRWQFERLQYQQSHDSLTGLLNRSQFRAQARAASRTSERYAVLTVDVDAFHEINESYGHMIGDAVLVEVGMALQSCALSDEIVGRVGGDIFTIYIGEPESREFVMQRARSFADIFTHSFSTGDREGKDFIARSASIGVAMAPDDGGGIDEVLSHADAALAVAKERGHGSLVFYTVGMERDAQRRASLRNELADAISGDQFVLYYQPHVELATGRVSGCEALIRWNHPERGLVAPGYFIPFAERAGIITGIDEWVMRNAFAAVREFSTERPDFRLYFNLSGRRAAEPQLVHSFVEAARSGVPLQNIGIEITETDAMRDVEASRRIFRALRRLNVSIAIDDFGTGYSSLSSLKALSVDVVKIDRSFISGVTKNTDDAAISETIISIADHFGFDSLGEGAEDPGEVEWLRTHGARYVQGYAVCHPLPMDEFKAWLAQNDRNPATNS